jgi:hypothetical protein
MTINRPIRWLGGALAALLALLAVASSASAHGPDPLLTTQRWNQNQDVRYAWRSGAVPPSAYQGAVNAAASDVNASRGSQAATFGYSAGASSLIGYGVGATCGTLGLACAAPNAPTSFTVWMREQGHVFDWGSLRWCQAYSSWPDGCYDVENIILDELGHVEMLNHHANLSGEPDYLDAVVQTKSRTKPSAGYSTHRFGRCDVATLQVQYDMQSWGAKYSTCLSLATTLAIAASPTAVAKGGTTTLTATLKVADVASYSRLALNPVALRTVTLQRRPSGTSSWTTVGTMPRGSTSGTYTMALSLTARTDFRAVFAAPSDEGLVGSTSPPVTVSVGQ